MWGFLSAPAWDRVAATALLLACLHLLLFGEVARGTVPTERTDADVVGASIVHPARWSVERERQTFDGTYGFTLWRPEPDPAAHDHGGTPAVRVALAYGLEPGQIEARVGERLAAYAGLPIEREEVSVGEEGHEGVAVGPIPGSTPSTEVYVPVNGRVYQINVYGEGLDDEGRKLLSGLKFSRPSRSVGSLGLPDGGDPATYYRAADEELVEQEEAARVGAAALSGPEVPVYGEKQIGEGCWRAKSTVFDLVNLTPPEPPKRFRLVEALITGLIGGLSVGLALGPVYQLSPVLIESLVGGLYLGLGFGLVGALLGGLISVLQSAPA